MADNNVIMSGTFTSTGLPYTITLPMGCDWMRVVNETETADTNNGAGVEYWWRIGMKPDDGFYYYRPAADNTLASDQLGYGGFTLVDTSKMKPGASIAVTAGTNATSPSYSTADTTGMMDGSIVRIWGSDQTDLNGLDFTVDTVVVNTSFDMTAVLANAPGSTAGAAGFWTLIAPTIEVYGEFYPSTRVIANIDQANPATVTTLVDPWLTDGQKVRINVPAACGMTQLNGYLATVSNVTATGFDIDIDTTGFDAFVFPDINAVPFTPATMIPVGEETSGFPTLADATENQNKLMMVLAAAANAPAGSAGDTISWIAGKSFSNVIMP